MCSAVLLLVSGCAKPQVSEQKPSNDASITLASDIPGRVEVAVVGGGLAGLVTAYRLVESGRLTHVFEAEHALGGRVQTAHYGAGLAGEYGLQEIWEGSPLLGLARELGLTLEGGETPFSSVLLDGKVYPFSQPNADAYFRALFTASEFAANARWMAELRRLLELRKTGERARAPELEALASISFSDWMKAAKLPPKVAAYWSLSIGCEVATDVRTISALSGLLVARMFVLGEKAFHVVGGNSRIIETLATKVIGSGKGSISLGSRVTRVEHTTQSSSRVFFLENNRERSLEARHVVIAVPWVRLHELQLAPPLDEARMQAIKTLGRGSYVVVHFRLSGESKSLWGKRSPFPVISEGPLGVIYGPVSSADMGSSGHEILFSLLIWGFPAQSWHMATHDQRIGEAKAELEKLWPGFSRYVHSASVYTYHPSAVTFFPPGRSPLDDKAALLRLPTEGRYLVGDWLEGSHSEGAVTSALRVASQIGRGTVFTF